MMKSIAGTMGIVVLSATLGCASPEKQSAAPASTAAQDQDSGFLGDYSKLEKAKDTEGQTIRAWASPKLTPANYHALLLDPLVFYPEPRPSEQVSAETLQQLLAYTNDALRRALTPRFNVVDRAGPGVLRIRVGLTSVAAKGEGLKPYQLIPMAFVVTMAKRAATGAPERAFIIAEVEGTDSLTGELLAQRIRVGTGERLAKAAGDEAITLENVKPLLDELAGRAFPELAKYVKPK